MPISFMPLSNLKQKKSASLLMPLSLMSLFVCAPFRIDGKCRLCRIPLCHLLASKYTLQHLLPSKFIQKRYSGLFVSINPYWPTGAADRCCSCGLLTYPCTSCCCSKSLSLSLSFSPYFCKRVFSAPPRDDLDFVSTNVI
jgi:hypothetical protein